MSSRKHGLKFWLTGFIALALVVVSPWNLPKAALAEPLSLKLAIAPTPTALPIFIAKEQKYFEEVGLKISAKTFRGGVTTSMALEAGDLNIAIANTVSVILAHTKGFDFQYLVNGTINKRGTNPVIFLIVGKDSGIRKFKELEGKKIALNERVNILELGLNLLADREGVNIKKMKLLEVPFPQMVVALKQGTIDAFIAPVPFPKLATMRGVGMQLPERPYKDSPFDLLGERFTVSAFMGKKSWLDKNREAAKRFITAIAKAHRWSNANLEKVPAVLGRNTKVKEKLARRIVWPFNEAAFRKGDIQPLIDLAVKHKFIKKGFSEDEIISTLAPRG